MATLFDFLMAVLPKLIAAFGIVVAALDFILREREIEYIRDRFIVAWLFVDRLSTSFIGAIRKSLPLMFIVGFLFHVILFIRLSNEENIPVIEIGAFAIVALCFMLFFAWVIRADIYVYINYIESAPTVIAFYFRLSEIPAIWFLFYATFDPIVVYLIAFVYGFPILMLQGAWFASCAMLLIYIPVWFSLFILERLCLRICELQRGPVLALAFILVVASVIFEVVIAG